ncbi:MAG TPA: hypothetical protein VKF41_08510 [Bryobacteraceae bacterium]|nr:hypothetical protein [Bryobacteraceae bacterium]
MFRLIVITVLISAAAALAWAGDDNAFQWQGEMTPDQTLAIRGVSGGVTADLAPGTLAQVTAAISAPGADPSLVQIQVVPTDGGVSICALYPGSLAGPADACGLQSGFVVATGIQVVFTVHVPAGVALDIAIVNGDIRATGLTGDFRGATVNGQIALSLSGSAQAATVNGSIVAVLGSVAWTGARSFTTVNGSIDATLPASADVVIHAAAVAGSISTDFPLSVRGSGIFCGSASTLNGALGSGGRTLDFATVNGSIHLRKSQ